MPLKSLSQASSESEPESITFSSCDPGAHGGLQGLNRDRRSSLRWLILYKYGTGLSLAFGALLVTLTTGTILGCGTNGKPPVPSLELSSASLSRGTIPLRYACSRENCPCDGQDISPELSWKSVPSGTQSFALVVIDKDSFLGLGSLFGYFVHWVLYDIPADERELPEGILKVAQLRDGSRQGLNGFDKTGYVGPCPPGHSPHRYLFDLYALDTKLNLQPGTSQKELAKAMSGHVLAKGELVGSFQH